MTAPISPVAAERLSRTDLIRSVGRRIGDPRMSSGALATLRRGTRHDVARQSAFHAAIVDIPDEYLRADLLLRWAALVQCVTLTGVPSRSSGSDGSLLAGGGLSESRFARLLASHGDGFFDQLLLVARFLRSKDLQPSWTELGELALTDTEHEARADLVRLRLARDYYRALTSRSTP